MGEAGTAAGRPGGATAAEGRDGEARVGAVGRMRIIDPLLPNYTVIEH